MKRKVSEIIIIIFFYSMQATLSRYIAIGGISPNFLIILPVIFGFLNGKNEGIFVGLLCGLLYDLLFNNVIGFSSLIFMYIGFGSGCFYQKYDESEMIFPLWLMCIGAFGFELLSYIGNFLLHNKLDFFYYFSRIIIPEVVFTVFITIILYNPLIFLNTKLEHNEKRRPRSFD